VSFLYYIREQSMERQEREEEAVTHCSRNFLIVEVFILFYAELCFKMYALLSARLSVIKTVWGKYFNISASCLKVRAFCETGPLAPYKCGTTSANWRMNNKTTTLKILKIINLT
jgi:hypothetical protein